MIGRRDTKLAAWLRAMLGVMKAKPHIRRRPSADVVKIILQQEARSSFTKKGPGVTAQLRAALKGLTVRQRMIAKEKGWDRGLLKGWSDGR